MCGMSPSTKGLYPACTKKTGTTRIGYKTITQTVKRKEVTRKVRYSKKSGEVLD